MDAYIGTKIIQAEPQVVNGQEGYKVVYEDGYTSWSPRATFERAYRRVTGAERALIQAALATTEPA